MREQLFRHEELDIEHDAVLDAIDNTIHHGLTDDVYLTLMPVLSSEKIGYDSAFLQAGRITPNAGFGSDELKTISYLATFHKTQVSSNINAINRYLFFIGYGEDKERHYNLVCRDKTGFIDDSKAITFEDFLLLGSGVANGVDIEIVFELTEVPPVSIYMSFEFDSFIDGFDIMHDIVGMK